MKLTIELTMNNAAFGETLEEASREAARIIGTKIHTVIQAAGDNTVPSDVTSPLVDLAGNTVGRIEVTPD